MTTWANDHPVIVIAGLAALCLWILVIVLVALALAWSGIEDRQRQQQENPPAYLDALEDLYRRPSTPRVLP